MGDVVSQLAGEDVNTLLTQELCNLTYEEFLKLLGELNILAQKCLKSKDYQLVFAVKKGTDSTVFWKATVEIACVKLQTGTKNILSYRLLSLRQFFKIFKTFKCQVIAAEQSKSQKFDNVEISNLFKDVDLNETPNECRICFDLKQDITLPCTHSFCTRCIEEWSTYHDTCPICRDRLDSPSDGWVISEVPKAEEISEEITENLLELTEERPSSCSLS